MKDLEHPLGDVQRCPANLAVDGVPPLRRLPPIDRIRIGGLGHEIQVVGEFREFSRQSRDLVLDGEHLVVFVLGHGGKDQSEVVDKAFRIGGEPRDVVLHPIEDLFARMEALSQRIGGLAPIVFSLKPVRQ